jgi:hypothetical protein
VGTPQRGGPRTSWDPTKAITVCDAINFIDANLDPGLLITLEMVR